MKSCSANSSGAGRLCAAALLLCAASIAFVPVAPAAKRVKPQKESRRSETHEIEDLEQQWRGAVVKGDATVLEKLLSDDFLAISARGTLSDKQQYIGRVASHATRFSAFDLMDLKIRVRGSSAVAISQAHITGLLEGQPIEGTFRYTKVYGRVIGTGWRMTNFEATRVSAANGTGMNNGEPLSRGPIPR